MKPSKEGYIPSFPDLVVEFVPRAFSSSITTRKAFNLGVTIASLKGLTKGARAYTSVQCGSGPNDHIELNSDLVYVNHSCDPNTVFDLSSPNPSDWHIRALKRLEKGTVLTFFYPSTEWDMDQAFQCHCNSRVCVGQVQGAKYLSKAELEIRGFINPWIWQLVEIRDGKALGS